MKKEWLSRFPESSPHYLLFLILLFLSFFSVSFPKGEKGRSLASEEDLEGLNKPETRVARKLLELGLEIAHEPYRVQLDQGVETKHFEKSGRRKVKYVTTPDFYFVIDGIRCFLEVGSNTADGHKQEQQKVMEEAIKHPEAADVLYAQIYNGHIDMLEQNVHTQEELLVFLYELSHAVYAQKTLTTSLR